MLKELTKEQKKIMYQVRDEWLDRIFSCKTTLNKKEATKHIKWLYKYSGLKEPMVVFLDNPYHLQIGANLVSQGEAMCKAENKGRNRLWKKMVDKKLKFFDFGNVETIWYYNVVAFYDFFQRINIIQNKDLDNWINLLKSGICFTIPLEGICFACPLPKRILRDGSKLHSDTKSAIAWDGYEQFYLYGIAFDKNLWTKITKKEMPVKDILSMRNIEQRMAAMKTVGMSYLLKELDAELLDTQKGVSLYLVKNAFSQHAYFLKYFCPSTGREYMSGIDPDFAKKNPDALKCMASKWELTRIDYNNLVEA